ncbi:MAG: DinB family protein [Chitinophagales bacterium]
MKTEANKLIEDLLQMTESSGNAARKFKQLEIDQLNFKRSNEEWSILECIEHLNLYGDFYLPEIEKRILESNKKEKSLIFRSGILGNYFANLMKVENGKITKMKAPKDKNPANSKLSVTTIDRFLKQQEMLKSLLVQAKNTDLVKTKTAISLTKFIRLRLGDTFRFLIYHTERHIFQAQRVLQ